MTSPSTGDGAGPPVPAGVPDGVPGGVPGATPTAPFTPLARVGDPVPGGGWEPRGDEPARAFPVPWRWWHAVLLYAAATVLTVLVLTPFAPEPSTPPSGTFQAVGFVVGGLVLVVVVAGWTRWRHPRDRRRLLGPVRGGARDALAGAGHGAVAYLALVVGFLSLLDAIARRTGNELPPVQETLQGTLEDPATAPITLFAVLLLAPLGEELLFRGVLFQGLRRSVGRWPAIGLSGLVFGLVHAEPGSALPVVVQIPVVLTFALGMYLAWLFHRSGTLVTTIAAHAAYNTLNIVVLYAFGATGPG